MSHIDCILVWLFNYIASHLYTALYFEAKYLKFKCIVDDLYPVLLVKNGWQDRSVYICLIGQSVQ